MLDTITCGGGGGGGGVRDSYFAVVAMLGKGYYDYAFSVVKCF